MNLENVEGSLVRDTALMTCSESSILFLLVILLMIIHKDLETVGELVRREMPSRVIPRAQAVSHHWPTVAKKTNISNKKFIYRYWLKIARSIIITVREQVSGTPSR